MFDGHKKKKELMLWAYKKFIKQYQWCFIGYVILKIISGIIGFVPPIFIGKAIDYAVNKDSENVIIMLGIIMVVLIVDSIVSIFESKLGVKINYLVTNEIKREIIKKIVNMEMGDIEEIGRGEFISRLEDAEGIVQIFMDIVTLVFIDVVAFVFALVVMIFISPVLSFICLFNIPVIMIIQNIFGKKIGQKEYEIRHINDNYYSFIYEILDAIKEIKIFNLQKEICNRYKEKLNKYTKLSEDKSDISIISGFYSVIVNGIFQLLMLAIGCYFIMIGAISVGDYFTFNSYASRFNIELQKLAQFHMKKQMYFVSIYRLQELLFMSSEMEQISDNRNEDWHGGSIRVNNVFFRYPQNEKIILNMETVTFEENEISVISGKNGAGKSTFFDLITRFYLFEGKIYIGNVDINNLSLEQLRKEICYIQQKPHFFNGSIMENLRLNDTDISFSEIENACKKVGINDYIQQLPDKYNTIINETGVNFSGGQLQRLALARAILSKSSIILLDEITSGIDQQSKYLLYNAIRELKEHHTVLIISHDDDIHMIADKMVYLVNGNVQEMSNSKEKI